LQRLAQGEAKRLVFVPVEREARIVDGSGELFGRISIISRQNGQPNQMSAQIGMIDLFEQILDDTRPVNTRFSGWRNERD